MRSITFTTTFHNDLQALGLPKDAVVMVHSSLKAFGYVEGGAQTVVDALISYLSPKGTLLMPALSFDSVHHKQLVFDLHNTPSCVGIIPETFRQMEGVTRSMHPTHSVCGIGKQAVELLKHHYKDHTPCGGNSPFYLLPKVDGYVLMLGCGLGPNTSFHAIEELVESPYLYSGKLEYTLIDAKGRETKKKYLDNGWLNGLCYDRIANVLDAPGLRFGKVSGSECFLLQAPAMWDAALTKYREDPLYFVDQVSSSHP